MTRGELYALLNKPEEALTHRDIAMLKHIDYMIEALGPAYLDSFPGDDAPPEYFEFTIVGSPVVNRIRIS